MTNIVWDKVGDRYFEAGVDRGVLYLPNGSAVPWNGLTSVTEKASLDSTTVYFDGRKINELVSAGDFSGTMRAITYPDELAELEGLTSVADGMYVGDQQPQVFGLCYRTGVGNDVHGQDHGYKLHILYDVIAVPTDKSYSSLAEQVNPSEFEWSISAIPRDMPGLRPSAHIILDSRKMDAWLIEDIERMLYGYQNIAPVLVTPQILIAYINAFYVHLITDHGDGTWSSTSMRSEAIQTVDAATGLTRLNRIDATYLGDEEIRITDTYLLPRDHPEIPSLRFVDNGDGTWKVYSDYPQVTDVDEDEQYFEISGTNAIFLTAEEYIVSSNTPTNLG